LLLLSLPDATRLEQQQQQLYPLVTQAASSRNNIREDSKLQAHLNDLTVESGRSLIPICYSVSSRYREKKRFGVLKQDVAVAQLFENSDE